MIEQRLLVERAKAGNRSAFEHLVQRNQGWVTGCAIILLGDYQLAEDSVQEAFAAAQASLAPLVEPEAFPGWLRSIVRHTCYRVLRKHRPDLVSLDLAGGLPSEQPDPGWFAEANERRHQVLSALSLPLAQIGMWPSVDPGASALKHLDVAVVGAEHVETATRTRDLLRRFPPEQERTSDLGGLSAEDQALNARARRLRRFLTQPLYVAAPWIRWTAAFVSIADTLRGCRGILDGAYDNLPEEAFYRHLGIRRSSGSPGPEAHRGGTSP